MTPGDDPAPAPWADPTEVLSRAGDEPPPPEEPRIPGFEVVRLLGRGGMGAVWLARETTLERMVALKILPRDALVGSTAIERFRREGRAAAGLDHPSIVRTLHVGSAGPLHYIVQEFVEGRSLDRWLAARDRPLDPAGAARLLLPVAAAVAHAHARGVVHRDLKPANVLVGPGEEPKLTDFGLARREGETALSLAGEVMGTPRYMAPEQVRGDAAAVGPATDVYGLGAILYELLAGRPPFAADSIEALFHRILADDPVPPSTLRPGMPRELEAICLACLEKRPADRYSGAEALRADLAAFLAGELVSVRPAGRLVRWARKARRRPLAVAAGGLALLLAGAGAWILAGPARLVVTPDPADADVYVDGEWAGRGRAERTIWPPGRRDVLVRRDGRADVRLEVELEPGRTTERPVALEPLLGSIVVESAPAGARILLDGRPTGGTTPAQLDAVAVGAHAVGLSLEGWKDAYADIEVRHGESAPVRADLEPAGGRVAIRVRPVGSKGRLERWDVSAWGSAVEFDTGTDRALPEGRWRLSLHGPDDPAGVEWAPEEDEFQIDADRPVDRSYRLDEKARVLHRGRPAGVRTIAGLLDDGDRPDLVGADAEGVYAWSVERSDYLWRDPGRGDVALAADFDGDGRRDVLVRTRADLHLVGGRTGRRLWSLDARGPWDGWQVAGPIPIDADPAPDLVVSNGGAVRAVSGATGRPIWIVEDAGRSPRLAEVGDLDGDGCPDVVLALETGLSARSGRTGSELWAVPSEDRLAVRGADLDADGRADVIAGPDGGGKVLALSGGAGRTLWESAPTGAGSAIALADLDGDGTVDLVQAGAVLSAIGGRTGRPLWSREPSGSGPWSRVAVGDLDGDGGVDVLATGQTRCEAARGKDGAPLWSVEVGPVAPSSILVDVDEDGVSEALLASTEGHVRLLDGRTGEPVVEYRVAGDGLRFLAAEASGDGRTIAVLSGPQETILLALTPSALRWSFAVDAKPDETNLAWAPIVEDRPLPDADGDGVLDPVLSDVRRLQVVSGRTGRLIWGRAFEHPSASAPALLDVDGDGAAEVVRGNVLALRARDGSIVGAVPTDGRARAVVHADVDGDGWLEAVLAWEDGTIRAVSFRGGRILWERRADGQQLAPILLDADGDGLPDAAVVSQLDGRASVLRGLDGVPLWTRDLETPDRNWLWKGVHGANADGDDGPDLVVAGHSGLVALSGRDGRELWARHETMGVAGAAVAGTTLVYETTRRGVVAIDVRSGAELWRADVGEGTGHFRPVLADLPVWGPLEALVRTFGGEVHAIDVRDGRHVLLASPDAPGDPWPVLADADGDGHVELVVGASGESLFVHDLRTWPLVLVRDLGAKVESTPIVRDLDGDGSTELLALSGGALACVSTRPPAGGDWDARAGLEAARAARLLSRLERVPGALDRFLEEFPRHEEAGRVFLMRASLRRNRGRSADARTDLLEARRRGMRSIETYALALELGVAEALDARDPRLAIAIGMNPSAAAIELPDPGGWPAEDVDAAGAAAFRAYRAGRFDEARAGFRAWFGAQGSPDRARDWIERADLLEGLAADRNPVALRGHLNAHARALELLDRSDRGRVEERLEAWRTAHPGEDAPELPWR